MRLLAMPLLGILAAVTITELTLWTLGLPHAMPPHEETRRFMPTGQRPGEGPVYVNYPGRLTFTYASNPAGYFSERNQVHHSVNNLGFRGPPFAPKARGARRIIFLGDSFTFGEGIRDNDVYAVVTAQRLSAAGYAVEPVNLGVGGYNTTQSATLLRTVGLRLEPDLVVLGYVPNDAEPPLFSFDPATGSPMRRNREQQVPAEGPSPKLPHNGIYRLRLARLVWQSRTRARLAARTIAHYQSCYTPESPGWQESRRALRDIVAQCTGRGIPVVVVMFPVLFELNASYPFKAIHAQVRAATEEAGADFIDLLPVLQGLHAPDLWVHPTDQHPNARVHAIAAEQLASHLLTQWKANDE